VELRQLEQFVAVAEERSFTRAGERLHLVQSGLSVAVRALERELGTPLFTRTTRRVELTDAGLALLPRAREVLAAVRTAQDSVGEVLAVVRGRLRVGLLQSMDPGGVPALLAEFHRRHPHVHLSLRFAPGGATELAELVRQGTLDVAFLAVSESVSAGLDVTPLVTVPMVLLAPPDHRLADARPVGLRELVDEAFVDFPPGWGGRIVIDEAFAVAGLTRSVEIEVGDIGTFQHLIGHGFGIGFLPRPAFTERRQLVAVPQRSAPLWRLGAAVATGAPPSTAARTLLALARSHRWQPPR
jgi:DNA-binding transcriptional LysR family regulator